MAEMATKRMTLTAVLLLIPAMALLSWWAWIGLEENLTSESRRIARVEELGAFQVVNNLGSELFHLNFTFSQGIAELTSPDTDWPRATESLVGTYQAQAHYPELLSDVMLVTDAPVGLRRWIRWSSGGWVPILKPEWVPDTMTLFDQTGDVMVDLENPLMVFRLPRWKGLRQVLVLRYSVETVRRAIVPDLVREAFSRAGESPGYDVTVVRQYMGWDAQTYDADLIVPLVPRVRFNEWLRNYIERTLDRPRIPQELYAPGSRWALRVNLLPSGRKARVEHLRAQYSLLVGGLDIGLGLGFVLILISLRRLLKAAWRERAFSSLVSHELKTPLSAIRALAENLADGVVSGDRVKDYGESLLSQSNRLGELVTNILSLTILEVPGSVLLRESFKLDELAREVAGRDGLPVDAGEGPWTARGNRNAVRAALDNLVTNALRHGSREGEPAQVSVGLVRREHWRHQWIGVYVSDKGPGLPRSEMRDLFRPYRRGAQAGRRQTPGGGVGLSLVRATMRHLGGEVRVSSVPGGGLKLTLWMKEGDRG